MFLLTAAAVPESRFDSCAICKFFQPANPRRYWRFWAFCGTKCGSEHCLRLEELEISCRVILPVSALYKADFPRDRFIVSADLTVKFSLSRGRLFSRRAVLPSIFLPPLLREFSATTAGIKTRRVMSAALFELPECMNHQPRQSEFPVPCRRCRYPSAVRACQSA